MWLAVGADRSTGERLSPPQAFKRMLDQYILPRIAQMAAGAVRQAMQSKVCGGCGCIALQMWADVPTMTRRAAACRAV